MYAMGVWNKVRSKCVDIEKIDTGIKHARSKGTTARQQYYDNPTERKP